MTLYAVHRCPDCLIRPAIERCHYLHRWPDPRALPFAYCLSIDGRTLAPDGRPFGAVVMKKLEHTKQGGLFGYPGLITAWQVLDLARVWVHPVLQHDRQPGRNRKGEWVMQSANLFSRMVSLVLKQVQRDWLEHHPPRYPHLPYHIELIVSYCDLRHHDGVGYRAANFTRWGLTQDGTKEIYIRRMAAPRWQYVNPQTTMMLEAA